MSTGLWVVLVAVAIAVAFGVYRQRVDGRFGDREAGEAATSTWSKVAGVMADVEPGERATLVQFSSAFCAPCRTTRVVLADVAQSYDGVTHIEVDAEKHLDLVRALDVRRTPTTLILDGGGHEITRAAGAPRRDQVVGALPIAQSR